MIYYYLFVISIFVAGMVLLTNLHQKRKIYIILFFIISFLFMGLRSKYIGTDTLWYCNYFDIIKTEKLSVALSNGSKGMYLYIIYNKIISYISLDSQILIISNAFIISLLASTAIFYIGKKHIFLSSILYIFMYYYFTSFNTSRQYIALLIVTNALYFLLYKKKYLLFLFLVIIASMFHITAIISFVFFPLSFFDFSKMKTFIIMSLIFIIFLLFSNQLIVLFGKIFPDYQGYVDSISDFSNIGRTMILILVNLVIFLCIFLSYRTFENNNLSKNDSFFLFLFLISILLGFISFNNVLLSRINTYFAIYSIFVIPYLVDIFTLKKDKLVISLGILVVFFIEFNVLLLGNYSGITPYSFY